MDEWPRFQKAVLFILAGMILVFGVLTFLGQFQKDLDFHGLSMNREDLPNRTVYSGFSVGNNEKASVSITCFPEDGGMRVEYAAGAAESQVYLVADGQAELLTAEAKEDYWLRWEGFIFSAEDALFFAGLPEPDRVLASWSGWMGATAFALMVMLMAAFPKALFKLRYMWQVEEPEPTKLFWLGHYFSLGLSLFITLIFFLMALTGTPF